jgi:aminoglycoside phosphotransferase family enzyme
MYTQATADSTDTRLAAIVSALRDARTYPEGAQQVEAIETHRSWVFLTEAHAYKLKKPVRTAHLDCTTLDKRRRACELELALNRRLAAAVYLAVVPLALVGGELRVGAQAEPVDWLVKMRRLPRDRMLDACIARNAIDDAEIDALTAVLVPFYASAERAGWNGQEYLERVARDIEAKGHALERASYEVPQETLNTVVHAQRRWLELNGALLAARAGSVVDAHGDLRPEHVCLEPTPVVIDCLEFDRELRLMDPVSEMAFLAIECQRIGAPHVGERLAAAYAWASDDHAPATLIGFYRSHHALVRAAVAIWHLDDCPPEHFGLWRARCQDYLRLAAQLA